MKIGRIRVILLFLLVTSLAVGHVLRLYRPKTGADELQLLRLSSPETAFSGKLSDPPHYRSADGSVAFNSYDITPSIRGYAGPIKLLVILRPDGTIKGITIVEHSETRNFVRYMESPEYLGRFSGKSISDAFEIDRDVDAISRATVSVAALAKTVRDSSRIVAARVYGLNVGLTDVQAVIDPKALWYIIFFAAAFASYFASRRSEGILKLRDLFLIGSIAVVGFYLASPFSILHVFNLLLLRPSSSLLSYAGILTVAVSVITAGRFYCGWICPFGAISEFVGRLPVKKWDIPAEADADWRRLKYAVLGILTILVLVAGRPDYANFETYLTLFSFSGNPLGWALVGLCLLAGLRVERFWCRYLCPVGALTGLFSRVASGYPSAPGCPMGNRPGPHQSECIRCNRCFKRIP